MPLEAEILGNKKKTPPSADTWPTRAAPSCKGFSKRLGPAAQDLAGGQVCGEPAGPSPASPLGQGPFTAPRAALLIGIRGDQAGRADLGISASASEEALKPPPRNLGEAWRPRAHEGGP